MAEQVFYNDRYVAYSEVPTSTQSYSRLIITDHEGEQKLDIGVSMVAVAAFGDTGLNGINIQDWLWKQALEYLEGGNEEGKHIFITPSAVREKKIIVPWETLEINKAL